MENWEMLTLWLSGYIVAMWMFHRINRIAKNQIVSLPKALLVAILSWAIVGVYAFVMIFPIKARWVGYNQWCYIKKWAVS